MSTVIVETNKLLPILDSVKHMKSEYIIIPRNLLQQSYESSILGVSYNAIVTVGDYLAFKNPYYYELWREPSLKYIALASKDIKNFFQMHKEYRSRFYSSYAQPTELAIDTNEYVVNNTRVSIGYSLSAVDHSINQLSQAEAAIRNGALARISLVPYNEFLCKVNVMMFNDHNSLPIIPMCNVGSNKDFMDIMNAKAEVGSVIWIPVIGGLSPLTAQQYAMSLPTTLMRVNNDDQVYCMIKDRIPDQNGSCFMVNFRLEKPKSKCVINLFMMMLKVV